MPIETRYTGFCPTLPQHFGESYGKATRQVLRERPQDLLKERLSDVRYRRPSCRFPKDSGDHATNSSNHHNGNKEADRCRCVDESEGRCVGRHYKDGGRNKTSASRWTNQHSTSTSRGNGGGYEQSGGCRQAQPAYIFIEAYPDDASDCCSHNDDRSCNPPPPTPPPPPKTHHEHESAAPHFHYPLFTAVPCQPIIADPAQSCCRQQQNRSGPSYYHQQRGTSGASCCQQRCGSSGPSPYQQQRGMSGASCCQQQTGNSSPYQQQRGMSGASCCQQQSGSSGPSSYQQQRGMSGQSNCGGKGYEKGSCMHKRPPKVPPFRQCGVIPKYTGHITGMKFTLGESFGPSSDRLLRKHHDKMKSRNIYYR